MYAKKQMGTLDVRIDPDLKIAILAKGQRGELRMRVHLAKKKNEMSKEMGDWPYYTLITQVKTPEEKFEEFLLKNRLKRPSPSKRYNFLAAKRSSTSALLSPSVCLSVLKRNFSLFGQLMTTYDSL